MYTSILDITLYLLVYSNYSYAKYYLENLQKIYLSMYSQF
jgi:hypothetical protein